MSVDDPRLYAPSAARNRGAILDAIAPHLPATGLVLEIASGTGEHIAHFAAARPALTWQPTDPEPDRRASIDAWTAGLPNVRPACPLDAASPDWPVPHAEFVLCINMIHIAPWSAAEGLLAGAGRILPPGRVLALYGPYRRRNQRWSPATQPSMPTCAGVTRVGACAPSKRSPTSPEPAASDHRTSSRCHRTT